MDKYKNSLALSSRHAIVSSNTSVSTKTYEKKQVKTLRLHPQTAAMRGAKRRIHTTLLVASRRMKRVTYLALAGSIVFSGAIAFSSNSTVSAAACPTPATDMGTLTMSLNVPGAATYNIWTRMMVPDATNNKVNLQINTSDCLTFDGGAMANTWVWVKQTLALPAGNATFKYVGTHAGVSVDRVILNSNLSCTPTGTGDNAVTGSCAGDSTGPTVSVTSPSNGAAVTGTVTVNATANDTGSGIKLVEFLVDGTVIGSDTTSPYGISWNSATVTNGSHTITARATDNADNKTTSAGVSVTVSGGSATKQGDLNGDGRVNITDLSILLTNWNRATPTPAQGDVNGDGRVNITDLSILLTRWG